MPLPKTKQTAGDGGHHREAQHLWFAEAVQRRGRVAMSELASLLGFNLDTFQRRAAKLMRKCLGWIAVDESSPEHVFYAVYPGVKYYKVKRAIRRKISPGRVIGLARR